MSSRQPPAAPSSLSDDERRRLLRVHGRSRAEGSKESWATVYRKVGEGLLGPVHLRSLGLQGHQIDAVLSAALAFSGRTAQTKGADEPASPLCKLRYGERTVGRTRVSLLPQPSRRISSRPPSAREPRRTDRRASHNPVPPAEVCEIRTPTATCEIRTSTESMQPSAEQAGQARHSTVTLEPLNDAVSAMSQIRAPSSPSPSRVADDIVPSSHIPIAMERSGDCGDPGDPLFAPSGPAPVGAQVSRAPSLIPSPPRKESGWSYPCPPKGPSRIVTPSASLIPTPSPSPSRAKNGPSSVSLLRSPSQMMPQAEDAGAHQPPQGVGSPDDAPMVSTQYPAGQRQIPSELLGQLEAERQRRVKAEQELEVFSALASRVGQLEHQLRMAHSPVSRAILLGVEDQLALVQLELEQDAYNNPPAYVPFDG
mgnify:CR=1 FL=1